MKKLITISMLIFFACINAQNKEIFEEKTIASSFCWIKYNDDFNQYFFDGNILNYPIQIFINTTIGCLAENKCNNVLKIDKNKPFFGYINKQYVEFDNIEHIESSVPSTLYCRKKGDFSYIVIHLEGISYSKNYTNNYIFIYLEKGIIKRKKIITVYSQFLSDKQIKHYMRNGLKY